MAVASQFKPADVLARYNKAKQIRDLWVPHYQECFDYAMPYRQSFHQETPGQKRTTKIYDETAVVGVQEFASRLQSGIAPSNARFAELSSGTDVPDDERKDVDEALDTVNETIFEALRSSNFTGECTEALMDVAAGTAAMLIEEGDAVSPLRFLAVPITALLIDTGPNDQIDTVIRERKMQASQIQVAYPKATIPASIKGMMSIASHAEAAKVEIIDCVWRDWSRPSEEVWHRCVVLKAQAEIIFHETYEGIGSNPWVVFRWSKAAGEVWGRGPLFNCMPAIKTTNLVMELILENAEMSIAGLYTAEDDGVINFDTLRLVPGTVIPRAPGSQGLQAIQAASNFNVADIVLSDQRNNIKRALYNDMLGNPEGTPMSATEVAERMADLARRIGAPYDRLWNEFISPMIRRVVFILRRRGLISLPAVNGKLIKVMPTSPLAQAQNQQDILNVDRWLVFLGQKFGPQLVNIYANGEEIAAYVGHKLNVPERLVRSQVQQQQMMQSIEQLAGAAPQQ